MWIYLGVLIITLVALLLITWFYHWKPRIESYRRGPFVNVNAKCPACGNWQGKLKMVKGLADQNLGERPYVQHTCTICEATWLEECVAKSDRWWKADPPKKDSI
jgi:hypothetical protein